MWSPEDLAVIRDRVIREWVTDRDPSLPLLVETEPEPDAPARDCKRGHREWTFTRGVWNCRACNRQAQERRRAAIAAVDAVSAEIRGGM